MDRSTKATLWIAFIVIVSYVAWFYLDCAIDDACQIICAGNGRRDCYMQWTTDSQQP